MLTNLLTRMPAATLEHVLATKGAELLYEALPNLPGDAWLISHWKKLPVDVACAAAPHLNAQLVRHVLAVDRRVTVFDALCQNPNLEPDPVILARALGRSNPVICQLFFTQLPKDPARAADLARDHEDIRAAVLSRLYRLRSSDGGAALARHWHQIADAFGPINPRQRCHLAALMLGNGQHEDAAAIIDGVDPRQHASGVTLVSVSAQTWEAALRRDENLGWLLLINDAHPAPALSAETLRSVADHTLFIRLVDRRVRIDVDIANEALRRGVAERLTGCGVTDGALGALLDAGVPCAHLLSDDNDHSLSLKAVHAHNGPLPRRTLSNALYFKALADPASSERTLRWAFTSLREGHYSREIIDQLDDQSRYRLLINVSEAREHISRADEVGATLNAGCDLSTNAMALLGLDSRGWDPAWRPKIIDQAAERWSSRSWQQLIDSGNLDLGELRRVVANATPRTAIRITNGMPERLLTDEMADALLDRIPVNDIPERLSARAGAIAHHWAGSNDDRWELLATMLADWHGSLAGFLAAADRL